MKEGVRFRGFLTRFGALRVATAFIACGVAVFCLLLWGPGCTTTPTTTPVSPIPTPTGSLPDDYEGEMPRIVTSGVYEQEYRHTWSETKSISGTHDYSATLRLQLRDCDTGEVLAAKIVRTGVEATSNPWRDDVVSTVFWYLDEFGGRTRGCVWYVPEWRAVGLAAGEHAYCSDGDQAYVCDVVVGRSSDLLGEDGYYYGGIVTATRYLYIPLILKGDRQ